MGLSMTSTPKPKILRLPKSILDSAKAALLAFNREEERTDVGPREIIVAKDVSLDSYLQYRERDKLPVHVRMRLVDGRIAIYEAPDYMHASVQVAVHFVMKGWNLLHLSSFTDVDMIVGQNASYTADIAQLPRNRAQPPAGLGANVDDDPYPTIVVEIGSTQLV